MKSLRRMVLLIGILFIVFSCDNSTEPLDVGFLIPEKIFPGDTVTAKVQIDEVVYVDAETKLEFIDVPYDSRCPENMICFAPGYAEVKLAINSDTMTVKSRGTIYYEDYKILLQDLNPRPAEFDSTEGKFIYCLSMLFTINDN